MPLRSMTGFARRSTRHIGFEARIEIKSVNARGLDTRVRVPAILDGFDIRIRKRVSTRLARGAVSVSLTLEADEESGGVRIDELRLASLISAAHRFESYPGVLPARIDGLLRLPGVVTADPPPLEDEPRAELEEALLTLLDEALAGLEESRAREGAELARLLCGQIDAIGTLVEEARAAEGARPETIRARLEARISELLEGRSFDEGRLEQEVAVLAVKQDVREELDRLDAHLAEARNLISAGSPAGRRLDFLAQEFNREANTLCSKSADTALTRKGLALKSAIEQFREQCQNVE